AVKSGTDSRRYLGMEMEGGEVHENIYAPSSAVFRQGRLKDIRGDPRFKDIPHDTRTLIDQWASKEFKNLQLAREAGLAVPTPIYVEKNLLLIEIIGKNGDPAPHLCEVPLQAASSWYDKMVEMVNVLFDKANLVHGKSWLYN